MVVLDVLVLLASPLVAEPPLVLLLTSASPELAVWLVAVEELTVLLFVTLADNVELLVIVLLDPGPVFNIDEVLELKPDPIPPNSADDEPLLLTPIEVLLLELLEAAPDSASPALVLFIVVASPVEEPCAVDVEALTVLLFSNV